MTEGAVSAPVTKLLNLAHPQPSRQAKLIRRNRSRTLAPAVNFNKIRVTNSGAEKLTSRAS